MPSKNERHGPLPSANFQTSHDDAIGNDKSINTESSLLKV